MAIKRAPEITDTIKAFAIETTVHGINLIADTGRSVPSRIFWALAFGCSTVYFVLNATLAYNKWQNEPDIAVKTSQRPLSEIPMPAITVCSPRFEKWARRDYRIGQWDVTQEDVNFRLANMHWCYPPFAESYSRQSSNRSGESIVELLERKSASIKRTFFACRYKELDTDCSKILNRVLTDSGLCFAFNMQGFDTIFDAKAISRDFHSYKRTAVVKSPKSNSKLHQEKVDDSEIPQWSVESGFRADHDPDAVPVTASKGRENSLGAFLKKNDQTCRNSRTFRYWLHLPNEIPTPFHHQHQVKLGETEQITLTARMFRADESLRRYLPTVRGCYFEGE
jgi:hypothetical protein